VDDMLFRELLLSAGQALDHARGKRELRTTVLPPPPKPMSADEVRHLRGALNVSQAVFARSLNVSTKLVQAWESKRRRPEGPALLLLRLLERQGALAFAYAKSSPSKARKVAEAVQRPGKRARRRAAPRR
jgi:putative transcriptional regulator